MTADALETLYARSHHVLASRAGGLRSPVEGVYTGLEDDAGLEHTTRQSRALGFFGRSALHPRQVPIINAIFTPSDGEIARARELVQSAAAAETAGRGALRLPNGDFVDVAIVQRAQATLEIARTLADAVAAALSDPGPGCDSPQTLNRPRTLARLHSRRPQPVPFVID
jgi:citrate lyase beta subunit